MDTTRDLMAPGPGVGTAEEWDHVRAAQGAAQRTPAGASLPTILLDQELQLPLMSKERAKELARHKQECNDQILANSTVGPEAAGAVKMDQSKVRPSLILDDMANALLAVAEVATYGAEVYEAHGWLNVPNGIERYCEAKDRHRLKAHLEGTDPESGLWHAAHEAWNALAVLELRLRDVGGFTESSDRSQRAQHIRAKRLSSPSGSTKKRRDGTSCRHVPGSEETWSWRN